MTNKNYEDLISKWHKDRNLIEGSTDKDQYLKLIQEAGELSDNICCLLYTSPSPRDRG